MSSWQSSTKKDYLTRKANVMVLYSQNKRGNRKWHRLFQICLSQHQIEYAASWDEVTHFLLLMIKSEKTWLLWIKISLQKVGLLIKHSPNHHKTRKTSSGCAWEQDYQRILSMACRGRHKCEKFLSCNLLHGFTWNAVWTIWGHSWVDSWSLVSPY